MSLSDLKVRSCALSFCAFTWGVVLGVMGLNHKAKPQSLATLKLEL